MSHAVLLRPLLRPDPDPEPQLFYRVDPCPHEVTGASEDSKGRDGGRPLSTQSAWRHTVGTRGLGGGHWAGGGQAPGEGEEMPPQPRGKSPPGQLPVAMGTLGSCALGLGPALDSP